MTARAKVIISISAILSLAGCRQHTASDDVDQVIANLNAAVDGLNAVEKAERAFKDIRPGMTYADVREATGSDGMMMTDSKIGHHSGQIYRWNNAAGIMIVQFQDGRVISKSRS